MINKQAIKNKKDITKNLKLKSDTEKILKNIQEAEMVKPAGRKPNLEGKDPDVVAEFKSLVSGDTFKRPAKTTEAGAQKTPEINICACGELDPQHKGYCTECLTKLKAKYDVVLEK